MELDTTFYVLGGVLVVLALVISYIGVRGKDKFPPSRGAMAGGIAVIGVVVIATSAYAVALAREEQEHREHEQHAEEGHAKEEERDGAESAGASAPQAQEDTGVSEGGLPPGAAPTGGAAEELAVSSPEDGSLAYEPPALQSSPATITLAYDNPSPVPHNINLEVEGETIAESEDVTDAATEVTAELAPGEYIYYCSIPGHREGGMEGVLTVE